MYLRAFIEKEAIKGLYRVLFSCLLGAITALSIDSIIVENYNNVNEKKAITYLMIRRWQ
tara:strand:- start:672 stop:848 length:177 start_codon:yes stop_codon:yes gene_type:complete